MCVCVFIRHTHMECVYAYVYSNMLTAILFPFFSLLVSLAILHIVQFLSFWSIPNDAHYTYELVHYQYSTSSPKPSLVRIRSRIAVLLVASFAMQLCFLLVSIRSRQTLPNTGVWRRGDIERRMVKNPKGMVDRREGSFYGT